MPLDRLLIRYIVPGLVFPATVLGLEVANQLLNPFAGGIRPLLPDDLIPWLLVSLAAALPVGMLLDTADSVMHVGAVWPFLTGPLDHGGRVIGGISGEQLRHVTDAEPEEIQRGVVRGWTLDPFYRGSWYRRLARGVLAILGLRIEPLHAYYRDTMEHNRQIADVAWRHVAANPDIVPEAARVQELIDRGHMLGACRVAVTAATIVFSIRVLARVGEALTSDDARRNAVLLAVVVVVAAMLVVALGRLSIGLVRLREGDTDPQEAELVAAADKVCKWVVLITVLAVLLMLGEVVLLLLGPEGFRPVAQYVAKLGPPLIVAVLFYRTLNTGRRQVQERRIFHQHALLMRKLGERPPGGPRALHSVG